MKHDGRRWFRRGLPEVAQRADEVKRGCRSL
ncbi:hypothetical protein NOCA1190023 [metagenome]|uniref:Uncharacterized protein n=1 Tax=metagenome TaxID=256318 RepID=A0A2P2CCF7_9ZZZZ